MVIVFVSCVVALALLMLIMKDARPNPSARAFLNLSTDFWVGYIVCLSVAGIFYFFLKAESVEVVSLLTQ